MKNVIKILILLSFTNFVHANELQLYVKCHKLFLKEFPSKENQTLELIKSKKITYKEACVNLLEKAKLTKMNNSYILKGKTGIKVFNTFNKLHGNFLSRYNLNIGTPDHPNTDIYDTNEMAYYFQMAMFKKSGKITDIFKEKFYLRGLRKEHEKHKFLIDKDIWGRRMLRKGHPHNKWKVGAEAEEVGFSLGPVYYWDPELIQFGELYGIERVKNPKNYIYRWNEDNKKTKVQVNKPVGGGILGSIPFVLLNAGHLRKTTNGGNIVHRRWSDTILRELLCRELPYLTKSEIEKYRVIKSKINYYKKSECMTCHASLDHMASIIRNLELYNSGDDNHHYTIRNVYVHSSKNFQREIGFNKKDFFQSKIEGKFLYKESHGRMIANNIYSLDELTNEIIKTKDFYRCMTSKYLNYLTGYKVNINKNKSNTDNEKLFEKISMNFKKHKSIINLIEDILGSKFFHE